MGLPKTLMTPQMASRGRTVKLSQRFWLIVINTQNDYMFITTRLVGWSSIHFLRVKKGPMPESCCVHRGKLKILDVSVKNYE